MQPQARAPGGGWALSPPSHGCWVGPFLTCGRGGCEQDRSHQHILNDRRTLIIPIQLGVCSLGAVELLKCQLDCFCEFPFSIRRKLNLGTCKG